MNCYKCKSEENLSAKKIDNHGNITFICRACRRDAYKKRGFINVDSRASFFDMKAWKALVKEKNKHLDEKYRDIEFMKARGLL